VFTNDDTNTCADSNFCNGAEVCLAGTCADQPDPNCDDGDACTADSCSVAGGACVHDPIPGCGAVCLSPEPAKVVETSLSGGVAGDSVGNYYLVGGYTGTLDPGAGCPTLTSQGLFDAYIAKYDALNNCQWAVGFGNSDFDQLATGVTVDQNGAPIVTGTFIGELLIVNPDGVLTPEDPSDDFMPMLDPSLVAPSENAFVISFDSATGTAVWGKAMNLGTGGGVSGIATDPSSGAIALVGTHAGTANNFAACAVGGSPPARGGRDLVVLKLNAADGTCVWQRRFGLQPTGVSGGDQFGRGVAVDSTGAVAVVGNYTKGAFNFGTVQNVPPFLPATFSATSQNVFVAKLDAAGTHVWSRGFGDGTAVRAQLATGAAFDAAGNVVMSGSVAGTVDYGAPVGPVTSTAGSLDMLVAKFAGGTGASMWVRAVGDAANGQTANSVTVNAADKVLVAGDFQGTVEWKAGDPKASAGDKDALVAVLNGDGTTDCAISAGDGNTQELSQVVLNSGPGGGVRVRGRLIGAMNFGATPATEITGGASSFSVFVQQLH
jgi:hypothetical protein